MLSLHIIGFLIEEDTQLYQAKLPSYASYFKVEMPDKLAVFNAG